MPNKVNKSPLKMSTKQYHETFEKNLDKTLKKGENFLSSEGQKKVRAAHKATEKQLGYTFHETEKRGRDTAVAQGRLGDSKKEASLQSARIPPKAVRKPGKKTDFTRAPRKK
jgi:hypothetical protein